MKQYNSKIDTMNGSDLRRVYNYPLYPTDSKIYSDECSLKYTEVFVNIDNGSVEGTHWTAF